MAKPLLIAAVAAGFVVNVSLILWATGWQSRHVCCAGEDCQEQSFGMLDKLAASRHYVARAKGQKSVTEADVLEHNLLNKRHAFRAKYGKTLTVLRIGANDSTGWDEVGDMKYYQQWKPRMVFVEPNPLLQEPLKEQLAQLDTGGKTLTLNAVVCEKNTDGVPFTAVELEKDASGYLKRGSSLGSAVSVRCTTPATLLEEMNEDASDIDVLAVDGEGTHAKIIELFLALEDLKPVLLQFEFASMAASDQRHLLSMLSSRGYDLHVEGPTMIAIHVASLGPVHLEA